MPASHKSAYGFVQKERDVPAQWADGESSPMVSDSQCACFQFDSFSGQGPREDAEASYDDTALALSHVCIMPRHIACLFPDDSDGSIAAARARRVDHSGFSSAACQLIPDRGIGMSNEGVFPLTFPYPRH